MEAASPEAEEGIPEAIEGWFYSMRTEEGKGLPIYTRRRKDWESSRYRARRVASARGGMTERSASHLLASLWGGRGSQ